VPACQQLGRDFRVTIGTGELHQRLAVPLDPEPIQAVQDGGDCRIRRALAIGVLDPEQELAAGLARKCPAEQRRTGAANMEVTGWRWRKARDDGAGHRKFRW
jgi:hypothetical protein